MAYSSGASQFKAMYELNPISLVGGIAGGVPGGTISILSLLQTGTFGGINGGGDLDLDHAFANFYPIAGSTLIDSQYGTYPFANMKVAANAAIIQPRNVSLQMRIPVREAGGYATKTQVMTALQNTLAQHNLAGGYYSVATPTFFYDACLLLKLQDVSGGESLQLQIVYQWDFFKPLVTLEDATETQNASMSMLSSGGQTDGATSGVAQTIGDPGTTAGVDTSPASAGNVGSGTGSSGDPTPGR
jgi:hypothetical protein